MDLLFQPREHVTACSVYILILLFTNIAAAVSRRDRQTDVRTLNLFKNLRLRIAIVCSAWILYKSSRDDQKLFYLLFKLLNPDP